MTGGRRQRNVDKGVQTRHALLKKAIELVAMHGYDQTSFQSIANACGVSQAAALFHFKSKFGLITAASRHCMEDFLSTGQTALDEAPSHDHRQRLQAYMMACVNWVIIKPAEAQILFLLYYLAAYENSFADLYSEFQKTLEERMEVLSAGDRKTAKVLHDHLTGLGIRVLAGRNQPFTAKEIEETIKLIIRSLVQEAS